MKVNIKCLLITGFIIVFISCEKSMFIDLPDQPKKIVVNGIMSPGYGLWMNLSESIDVSENLVQSYMPVKNAVIDYYENDILITSISSSEDGNYYERDFKPAPLKEYKR